MLYTVTWETEQNHEVLVLRGVGHEMRIVPSLGANWYSWKMDGTQLFAPWDLGWKGTKYGVPVLFPTPNRVPGGRYRWQGKTYTQFKNGEPRVIHGLAYDEPFTVTRTADGEDGCEVVLELRISQGELFASFPFPCVLSLTYRLDARGPRLAYRVESTAEAAVPYGFAIHPYFAKMDPPEETFIRVPAPYVHEADEDKIPSGRVLPVAETCYDLREFRSIADAVLDHVYQGMAEGMRAELEWRRSGIAVSLTASAEFDHIVVFTPADRPCICLENQTCSTDAHNRHADGFVETAHLLTVEPGEAHEGWIAITARKI